MKQSELLFELKKRGAIITPQLQYAGGTVPLDKALSTAYDLPPEAGLAYLNKRGANVVTSENWKSLSAQEHNNAFTVAKVASADTVQDIFDKIQKGYNTGKSLSEMKKDLLQFLPESRLTTIIQTNIQTSYMKGRYDQQMKAAKFGLNYWQWIHVNEGKAHQRMEHHRLHLMVFRYDDPFWDTSYPSRGHNCACRVRALTAEQVQQMGLTVQNDGLGLNIKWDEGWNGKMSEMWQPDLSKYVSGLKELLVQDLAKVVVPKVEKAVAEIKPSLMDSIKQANTPKELKELIGVKFKDEYYTNIEQFNDLKEVLINSFNKISDSKLLPFEILKEKLSKLTITSKSHENAENACGYYDPQTGDIGIDYKKGIKDIDMNLLAYRRGHSTSGSIEHVLIHEFIHKLDYTSDINNLILYRNPKFKELYKKATKMFRNPQGYKVDDEIALLRKEGVSMYSFVNEEEFIAETVAGQIEHPTAEDTIGRETYNLFKELINAKKGTLQNQLKLLK
jgi:SPP1 gp7 family putative phage head morphogenesis protein